MKTNPKSDFTFKDRGSTILMTPLTKAGRDWVAERLVNVQREGEAIVLTPPVCNDVLVAICEEGLKL